MTPLILCTSTPSKLFLNYAVRRHISSGGDTIILASSAEINRKLKDAGLPSQNIMLSISESQTERDRRFAELAMPGVFGDKKFPGTDLEVWKVMSMDRLSFWNGGINSAKFVEIIELLDWDALITDVNIYSPLPFAALSISKSRGVRSVGVQSHTLRSKEFFDIAPFLDFDEMIVYEGEEQLAKRTGARIIAGGAKNQKQIGAQSGQGLRSGFGIGSNTQVTGVIFDKRYEAQARMFLSSHSGAVTVFLTVDNRSKELLYKCLPDANIRHIGFDMLPMCNTVIAFGWHEELERVDPKRLTIIDLYGLSGAKDVVPQNIEVKNDY